MMLLTRSLLRFLAPAISLALVALPAPADESIALGQVTPAMISAYQAGIESGCLDAGKHRGQPAEQAAQFCHCVITTLRSEVSEAEWKRAYAASATQDGASEEKILAPHFAKLQACRNS